MSVYDDLMRFKPDGVSPNGWAVLAEVSRTVWTDMRRHDNPSRRTLEKLLAVAGSSLAEFEALRTGEPPDPGVQSPALGLVGDRGSGWRAAPLSSIPVYATTAAKHQCDGEIIDRITFDRSRAVARLARPASLAADTSAFAITVVDDAMWPRFRQGRRLIASAVAPVAIGDDVLVLLGPADGGREVAVIGALTRRSGTAVDLRQFNPDRIIHLNAADAAAIVRIVGEAY